MVAFVEVEGVGEDVVVMSTTVVAVVVVMVVGWYWVLRVCVVFW